MEGEEAAVLVACDFLPSPSTSLSTRLDDVTCSVGKVGGREGQGMGVSVGEGSGGRGGRLGIVQLLAQGPHFILNQT